MRILVDQDGVLADFEGRVEKLLRQRYPDMYIVPAEHRHKFEMEKDYPKDQRPLLEQIYYEPGFFAKLDPIAGSIEGVQNMIKRGMSVTICTSPLTTNPTCMND